MLMAWVRVRVRVAVAVALMVAIGVAVQLSVRLRLRVLVRLPAAGCLRPQLSVTAAAARSVHSRTDHFSCRSWFAGYCSEFCGEYTGVCSV